MTREEAIQQLQNCKDLIKQDGQDYLDERDVPILDMAIEALTDRPKGEWIPHATSVGLKHYIEYARCSECGEMALISMHFCPNCGADMRGDTE